MALESFARAGMGLMLVVSCSVGVRLLRLAARSHQLPELVMGLASLSIGGGAFAVVLGSARAAAGASAAEPLVLGGCVVTSLGAGLLCAGMWRIFRPDRPWPGAATALVGLVLAATCTILFLADHAGAPPTDHPAYRAGLAMRIVAFLWVAIESLGYAARLRRRMRLGLAEPLMVHRFACWGVSSCTAALGYGIFLAMAMAGSAPGAGDQLLLGALGTVTAASMWTAFFPPAFYRRWAERDATPSAAAPSQ